MKEKVTVLIADDNEEFSKTLASYINAQEEMEVIARVKDGTEAVDIILNESPEILSKKIIDKSI